MMYDDNDNDNDNDSFLWMIQFLRSWGGSQLEQQNRPEVVGLMICCHLLKEESMIMTGMLHSTLTSLVD